MPIADGHDLDDLTFVSRPDTPERSFSFRNQISMLAYRSAAVTGAYPRMNQEYSMPSFLVCRLKREQNFRHVWYDMPLDKSTVFWFMLHPNGGQLFKLSHKNIRERTMYFLNVFRGLAHIKQSLIAMPLIALVSVCMAAPARAAEPLQVQRYDDADDYLPSAEKKNKDGIRLLLKQQEGEDLFKVLTPRNVLVDVVAHVPKDSIAAVVILIGGTGVLSIVNDKLDRSFSFQPRSRDFWWSNRFATFLVDAPSDRLGKDGIQDSNWRNGQEHKTDLEAVLQTISKRFSGPLVIYGHSNGANSLANVASLNISNVKAYVFSGPAHNQPGTNLLNEVGYGAPVLLFQHSKDSCVSANSRLTDGFFQKLKTTSKKLIWIDGGSDPISGACGPFGYHSFFGVEKKTIDQMASEIGNVLK